MSLKSILKSIGKFISSLSPFAKNAISHGMEIANEIKQIADNPAWDVVASFTSTKLDDVALSALRLFMTELVKDLGLADRKIEQAQQIGVVLKQASASINSMSMPEAKAGILNAIAAAGATKIAELKGISLPIENSLTTAQVAYKHPELIA